MQKKLEWKKQYVNYKIENQRPKANKILRKSNHIKQLFQFRSGKDYDLENLKDGMIHFTESDSLNDPYDCALFLGEDYPSLNSLGNIPEKQKKVAQQVMVKGIDYLNGETECFRKKFNVSCFTEHVNSLCMWSHYADSHKGFCVEYGFEMLLSKFDQLLSFMFLPVCYENKFLPINECAKAEYSDDESVSKILGNLVIKAKEWQYEKEWRIICIKPNQYLNYNNNVIGVKPSAVYLGCKSQNELKEKIKAICEIEKIPLYQMKMEKNSFNLKSESL